MKRKTRMVFILPNLKAGGAERVLSFLFKEINKDKFEVFLVVLGFKKDAIYGTDKVIFLNKDRLLFAIPQLLKTIFSLRPNIVFGSIVHVNIFLGLLKFFLPNQRVIIREASVLSEMSRFSTGNLFVNSKLVKFSYNQVDVIVCQSQDMLDDFKANYSISASKLRVINNPITKQHDIIIDEVATTGVVKFITIGRLSAEKGYDRILEALSKVEGIDFQYTIVGVGPLKERVFSQIKELNLSNRVSYIPHTDETERLLGEHHLFLQGSYVEGFPNSVLESCCAGTPVLAFSSPGGTKEIIEEGLNGFIVSTPEDFLKVLTKPEIYMNLNRIVVKNTVEKKFSKESILSLYENLFFEIVAIGDTSLDVPLAINK